MTLLHSLIRFVRRLTTRLFGRTDPIDPCALVRVPSRRGPNTRSGAVALIELAEPHETVAVGRRH